MRKIFILLSMVMLTLSIQAQTVEVNFADLTPEQRTKIEAKQRLDEANQQIQNLQDKIDTYGQWIGVGGEIGTAVNEGLSAVVDVADKFGKTDVGKFTLIMIAWKVMGKDVIKIVLGLFFFVVLMFVLFKLARRTIHPKRILIETISNGFWNRSTKKYETVESNLNGDEKAWLTAAIIVAFLIGIWITYGIMF